MADTISRRSVDLVSKDSLRKSKKPLMEKRRRLRINTCLNQLKSLVLQALNKDGSHFSKLEKADILEMTVKYLRGIQRSQIHGQMPSNSSTQAAKYRAGFSECANEVVRYVHAVHGVNGEVRSRLMGHLANCMQVVNSTPEVSPPRVPLQPLYVQVPNTGVATGQDITTTTSATAARQNMLLWSQQQTQVHPMMASMVPQGGARSPPFVSPYSQGSSRSSSPSSSQSIPSPSYSDHSSTSGTPTRVSPMPDLHSAPAPEAPVRQHLEQQPSAMLPPVGIKCKEENVWRPW